MDNLILYTIHCPKCTVLQKKLDAKGLNYRTCEDTNIMQKLGINLLPVLQVNNKLLSFSEAIQYIELQ